MTWADNPSPEPQTYRAEVRHSATGTAVASDTVTVDVLPFTFGASLGFPVGMSAAADEPRLAAARVGTVSAIGYIAFLAGPPLLGLLGDLIGLRLALLAVLAFVLLSLLTSHVARERTAPGPAGASVTKEAS